MRHAAFYRLSHQRLIAIDSWKIELLDRDRLEEMSQPQISCIRLLAPRNSSTIAHLYAVSILGTILTQLGLSEA